MLRIISELTLEVDEDLSVCFIDWQKTFDRVNWTKLTQILKKIGIGWMKEVLRLEHMVLKLGRFGQWIRNTWKVLKCGAGGGWKRSVGLIM